MVAPNKFYKMYPNRFQDILLTSFNVYQAILNKINKTWKANRKRTNNTIRIYYNRSTTLKRSVINYWGWGLNRFYARVTIMLGSAVVHKYTWEVVWSTWRTSIHQCIKTANIQFKIQHWDETGWVLNSKTNTEMLEQQKPNSWIPVGPTKVTKHQAPTNFLS